jgi:hypothetical protein
MSLFKGRDDVYAKRWESKDGTRSGYSPACRNEWKRDLCVAHKRHAHVDSQQAAHHLLRG